MEYKFVVGNLHGGVYWLDIIPIIKIVFFQDNSGQTRQRLVRIKNLLDYIQDIIVSLLVHVFFQIFAVKGLGGRRAKQVEDSCYNLITFLQSFHVEADFL
jgi:hypothetical protein